MQSQDELVFLKWGGSLITVKDRPFTVREDVLRNLARAVAQARKQAPDLRLVLGHGSGSFGHTVARRYRTREGVSTPIQWRGFAEVARAAARLHQRVLDALLEAGVPVLSFPPSATVLAQDGQVLSWFLDPLTMALEQGLVPVIYGDAVLDRERGGTILSTEDLFVALAARLKPRRILLAGREPGVWADYPHNTRLLEVITPETWSRWQQAVGPSDAPDVTGGMREKVRLMLNLALQWDVEGWIFSGEHPDRVMNALLGQPVPGTRITRAQDGEVQP